jgi:membrane protease YdiL (CAAX protease family)
MIALSRPATLICFHVLAFILIVAAPLTCWATTARIKAAPSRRARLRSYQLAGAFLLVTVLAVFALVPPSTLFEIPIRSRGITWLPSRELISGLAILLVLITEVPLFLARKAGPFKADFQREMQRLSGLLPHTRQERIWFCIVAIAAAVGEEILYRGFLLHYLHLFPWRMNGAASIAIACIVFGLLHLYRGAGRLLQTILLALGMSILFVSTRSLLLPIVLHLLIGLRMLIVLPDVLAVDK